MNGTRTDSVERFRVSKWKVPVTAQDLLMLLTRTEERPLTDILWHESLRTNWRTAIVRGVTPVGEPRPDNAVAVVTWEERFRIPEDQDG